MEKASPPDWQSLYLLKTSKTRFNVSSEYQGCHSDDRPVSVYFELYLCWISTLRINDDQKTQLGAKQPNSSSIPATNNW